MRSRRIRRSFRFSLIMLSSRRQLSRSQIRSGCRATDRPTGSSSLASEIVSERRTFRAGCRLSSFILLAGVMAALGSCQTAANVDSTASKSAATNSHTAPQSQPVETKERDTAVVAGGGSESAQATAREFVDQIRAAADTGDFAGAATMWSGYPHPEEEKMTRLQAFIDANRWLLASQQVEFTVVDAWAWEPESATTVVAITDLSMMRTAAVLVDQTGTIQRIQTEDDLGWPVTITGNQVVLPVRPVEGDVLVYLDGEPIDPESVDIDPEEGTLTITLPGSRGGTDPAILIVSAATPELPTALSILLP